ncbi:MAG: DUF4190 domain-containing protein [Phycisphaerales bacterium]|nr:DUF4190 domain-containing protein [Planctomycetota bacterium]
MTTFNAGAPEREVNWGPERTSILAILALVFALPCFIPMIGIIASLLAVFALVGISSSRGRVGGTGLAVSALVIGLFSTALWTAIGYGAYQMMNAFHTQFVAPTASVLTEVQAGEWDKAKTHFVASSAAELTPERFAAFRDEYTQKIGAFQGVSSKMWEVIADYGTLGPIMQNMKQPPPNSIPLPMHFDKGGAMVMLEFEPPQGKKKSTPGGTISVELFPIRNITIVTASNEAITLIDPARLPSNSGVQFKSGIQIKTDHGGKEESAPEKTPATPAPAESKPQTPGASPAPAAPAPPK